MAISCIHKSVADLLSATVDLNQKEVRSAFPVIRGVHRIPGRGMVHLMEVNRKGGKCVPLRLATCSIHEDGTGRVRYENKKDGGVRIFSDVKWSLRNGQVAVTPDTWASWSPEDKEVFLAAVKAAGKTHVVWSPFDWELVASLVGVGLLIFVIAAALML